MACFIFSMSYLLKVTRPHYQQPAVGHMVPTVSQNINMQPQEIATEVSQRYIPETFQPRQAFVPRNPGTGR